MKTKTSVKFFTLAAGLLAALTLTSCADLNSLLGYDQKSQWYRDRTYVRTWWPSENPRADAFRKIAVAPLRVQDAHHADQAVLWNYGVPPVYKKASSIQSGGPGHYNAGQIHDH